MAYSIYHHYTYEAGRKKGSVLLGIKGSLNDAEAWVLAQYAGRFMTGRDYVAVHDEAGTEIIKWEVDYMAQFEAMPGMRWTFASSSGSGIYTTQVNTTGILSCNCKGWTMRKKDQPRHCKHTDEVARTQGLKLEERGQYLFLVNESLNKAKQKFAASP